MLKTFFLTIYGIYAALAFVVVVLLLFCPLLIAAPTLRVRRKIGRITVRAWLAAIFVPLRVRGLDHLPQTPCVVLCNHASYVDGIVLTAALPENFTFLVQHEARQWPYVGLIIRRMGVAFVNRHAAMPAALALRRLIRAVDAGESVAIFPEGSFRKSPGLMRFYGGAFAIAAKAGVPVVPAVMRGTRRILSDGEILPRPGSISIEFFAPISAAGNQRLDASRLGSAARRVMLANCGEIDGEAATHGDSPVDFDGGLDHAGSGA
ncbi:MAG: lysophospholipid acyltransferase family protein [Stenotrophobium sp.]